MRRWQWAESIALALECGVGKKLINEDDVDTAMSDPTAEAVAVVVLVLVLVGEDAGRRAVGVAQTSAPPS